MRKVFILLPILFAFCANTLAQETKTVKLTGQVVCSLCWFEAGDRKKTPYGTTADVTCAAECSENGLPQALAVEDEKGFTLYVMEPGSFNPSGKDFLDLVPKTVEVEGVLRSEKDKNFIKVNSLKVVETAAAKPVPVSDEPVALALKDLAGVDQSLASLRGRVVVLNFWATWCEPCKKEMPDLAAIQNDYAPLGVQVIGATADGVDDAAKVLKFTREFKINFPVWLGATTADMERLRLGTVLPGTVIIDREGKIAWRQMGIIRPAELRKELDKLLAPKPSDKTQAVKEKKKESSLVPA